MKNILLLILSLSIAPLLGQEKARELTPVEELMETLRIEQTIIDGGEANFPMVAQSLADQNLTEKEMGEVKDAFMVYMEKLARDEEFLEKTIAIYKQNFTNEEIKELTAFYKTPLGKKTLEKLPAITGEVMLLSQKIAQRHIGTFQTALAEILEAKAAKEQKNDE